MCNVINLDLVGGLMLFSRIHNKYMIFNYTQLPVSTFPKCFILSFI